MKKPREITIMDAFDTQDYSHEEMDNLVFVEKEPYEKIINDVGSLLTEMDTYLSRSKLEQICSNSLFHKNIKELISRLDKEF